VKALVFQNGELRLATDYPLPEPASGEALVRVNMAGICATDLEIVKGYMGFEGVLGHEFSGVVEAAADDDLVGKRVVGEINCACCSCDFCREGLERHCPDRSVLGILGRDGAFAEYLALPEENLHPIPDSISDKAAVFVEPLAAAFEILEQLEIGRDDSVCILGDGRLGLLVAQVLALSASSLLTIGRHPENLEFLRARGIETAAVAEPGTIFDIVVDCTGAASGISEAVALVKPRGVIVLKTTVADERSLDLNQLVINETTLIGSRCGPFTPAIEALAQGKVEVEPLVGKVFPLDAGVEAFNYARQTGTLKVLLKV
jgi:threonine dehydrogenase-like Zn-dependent dehydrogenase